ncbi:signal peptidase I [Streptococcus gallinaceus]|uniref:Signal peptidase I n=1 Tax=Streptococcus gallinaceus TaxID=165758 RepID=A0ABV2JN74_9STRE|nr:signal peptidase I [Streptococcus gallinaceus]MCP1639275.1 signal peptidase I [Streptococcus gallinaceus]MCP1770081.1 signal peptidase I [Streptococcus gallinaceus]
MESEKLTSRDVARELERVRYQSSFWMIVRNTLFTLLAVVSLAILVAVLWLPVLRIYGNSMNKTLQQDDIVLTVKESSDKVETGDVLAFYYNNKVLVKRVIAKSGDWVDIDSEGTVYVNQKELAEPYVDKKSLGNSNITYPYQVPDDQIFVLGDNREVSIDSRNTSIGTVTEEQVVGKIVFKVWPLKSFGAIK